MTIGSSPLLLAPTIFTRKSSHRLFFPITPSMSLSRLVTLARRPKMRKLISWFGFKESNRSVALKQLTVAAATGNDVHGYFASLTLLTFYCLVLLSTFIGFIGRREARRLETD